MVFVAAEGRWERGDRQESVANIDGTELEFFSWPPNRAQGVQYGCGEGGGRGAAETEVPGTIALASNHGEPMSHTGLTQLWVDQWDDEEAAKVGEDRR